MGYLFFATKAGAIGKPAIFIATIVVLLSGPLMQPVGAVDCPKGMSALDCEAIVGDYPNWVPNGCGASTSTELTGADNSAKAFNFLLDKGVPAKATAAIVGNLWYESGGVDPRIVQEVKPDHPQTEADSIPDYAIGKGGYGIAQWTDANRQKGLIKAAADAGKQQSDLGVQLSYLWTEILSPTYSKVLDDTEKAAEADDPTKAINDATNTWMLGYERPDLKVANLPARQREANTLFEKYGNTAAAVCVGSSDYARFFTEYKQCNDGRIGIHVPWASDPYGAATVCAAACGPSAMAMIITNMTGQRVTPDVTAQYGYEHGTAAPLTDDNGNIIAGTEGKGGSYWSVGEIIGDHWGLKSTEIGFDESDIPAINEALRKGGLILATGRGPLPFSDAGHFLVVRAVTSDGMWLLGNSMVGIGNTIDTKYDPKQLTTSTAGHHNAWVITKK